MTVKIVFTKQSLYAKNGVTEQTLHNITEIHFNYDGRGGVAFESDVECTGWTFSGDQILEFEARQ